MTPVAASFGIISTSDADAGGYEEVDLLSELIQKPDRTILLEVVGDSMRDEGIRSGSLLVVETPDVYEKPWIDPDNGACVIALVDGKDLTVKKFRRTEHGCYLVPRNPRNPQHQQIRIRETDDEEDSDGFAVKILGIVRSVTRKL